MGISELAGVFNGGLTRPALINPQTGQAQYFDSPDDAMARANQGLANFQPPMLTPKPLPNVVAAADPQAADAPWAQPASGPDVYGKEDVDGVKQVTSLTPPDVGAASLSPPNPFTSTPASGTLSRYERPTYAQATTDKKTGMQTSALTNPGLTKLGKFMQILSGAAQGAMAGQASAEQAVQASGGHRGGGVGQGFAAGVAEPYRRAAMQRDAQMGQLQTQQAQMQLQQAQTPMTYNGKQVPFWQAKQQMEFDKGLAGINKDKYTPNRTGGFIVNETGEIVGAPEKPTDKVSHSYVGADGKQHVIYQRADNTSYDTAFGDVNEKNPAVTNAQSDAEYRSLLKKQELGQSLTADEKATKSAYEKYVAKTKVEPGVARANIFINRPTEVADPNNPGETVMVPGNQTAGMAGKGSASVQTPKKMDAYMTSGKGGQTLNAFNTAIAHLDTLEQLSDALNNRDTQAINRVGNYWKTQTGSPAPVSFEAARAAVAGEIAAAFKSSGATDQEIKAIHDTFATYQSPGQLKGGIATYRGLLNSKRDALKSQYGSGKKGKANFGTEKSQQGNYGGVRFTPLQ